MLLCVMLHALSMTYAYLFLCNAFCFHGVFALLTRCLFESLYCIMHSAFLSVGFLYLMFRLFFNERTMCSLVKQYIKITIINIDIFIT